MSVPTRTGRFELEPVHLMPKDLESGILYVSKEFGTAAHLCACGCGSKVRTPLGPTAWTVKKTIRGPTLWPSVGNWQKPCKSHYLIVRGDVIWAGQWTDDQIVAGRAGEAARRESHYAAKYGKKGFFVRMQELLRHLFR